MTLEEKAKQAKETADLIQTEAQKIIDLCNLILVKREVNGEALEYTVEQKQKVIQAFRPKKTRLQALVEALP